MSNEVNRLEALMKEIKDQEKELQFNKFNNLDALNIGIMLVEKAKKGNLKITIDIAKNNQQLFHYSCEGTSPDNDQWVIRKNRVVNRFYTSSLYIGTRLKLLEKTMEEKYNLSSAEYAASGGAFPLIIKDAGVVGTITVSGLAQEEDHKLVVEAIREYLNLK